MLAEIRSGQVHGVFIDDTGSPGLDGSAGLHPDRKSWVGVVVPSHQAGEVFEQLPNAIAGLKEVAPASREFHFTDIYAGKRRFKGLDIGTRLAVFRFMAWVFDRYRFPVVVQTFDLTTLNDIRTRAQLPPALGPLKLTKHDDLALVFLLLRIKRIMTTGSLATRQARVFVDEGRFKSGASLVVPAFASVFRDGFVSFADSHSVLPLQLADFAAFVLNRWQLLVHKTGLTDLDRELLTILTPVAECFVEGTEKLVVKNSDALTFDAND